MPDVDQSPPALFRISLDIGVSPTRRSADSIGRAHRAAELLVKAAVRTRHVTSAELREVTWIAEE